MGKHKKYQVYKISEDIKGSPCYVSGCQEFRFQGRLPEAITEILSTLENKEEFCESIIYETHSSTNYKHEIESTYVKSAWITIFRYL